MTIYDAMWSGGLVTAFFAAACGVGIGIAEAAHRVGKWASGLPKWQGNAVVALAIIALFFAFVTAAFYAGGA